LLFSIPRQRSVSLWLLHWLACPRLFISPRASVLDCRPKFTPHSLFTRLHLRHVTCCRWLSSRLHVIHSHRFVCYISFSFLVSSSSSTTNSRAAKEVYNITTQQYLDSRQLHTRQHHCEAIRIDRPALSATQDKPTERLEWTYDKQTGGDYTQVTRYLVTLTLCADHLRV
jgi:hypothetical protein